ncbi:MAG: DUF2182 domain-containing protein [Stagnimonas sp.]|nr:DUF2182 domain-containing protein [Stagnimonas sp.]
MSGSRAGPTAVEALLRRERLLYLAAPLAATALAWLWLVPAALDMYGSMRGLSAWMMVSQWDLRYGLLIFLMWSVMMAAMMLPSLAPALLLYGGICRSDVAGGPPALRVYAFALGYLGAWVGYSAAVTLLQWQLFEHGLLTMMMALGDARVAAAALILAGVFQLTPLKQDCLTRCRSPAAFLSEHWRRGAGGALRLGFHYGLFCLGCCWALMLVLFVCGVMNLAYIVLLSLLVLMEKAAPWGARVARVLGGFLIAAGVYGLGSGWMG